jgi:Fic family protein
VAIKQMFTHYIKEFCGHEKKIYFKRIYRIFIISQRKIRYAITNLEEILFEERENIP